MDPLGNIPMFLSVLKSVSPKRWRRVLMREIGFAYIVLLACLFLGNIALELLRLEQETISIAGGIVLFLIALRMIFPSVAGSGGEALEGEPFPVPLVVPMIVDPSAMAALLLLRRSAPEQMASLLLALTWSSRWRNVDDSRMAPLNPQTIAVQMFMNRVKAFLAPLSGHVGRPDYAVKLPGIGFPLNKGGE